MTNDPKSYMRAALKQAEAAASLGEVPVGAVVVKNGEIISAAHNLVETNHDVTVHAEILAIRRAGEKLGSWRLDGCELFVTLEPCPMCIGAILLSRLDTLYFGAYDEKFGAVGSNFNLADSGLPRAVKVISGLMEQECSSLLTEFFEAKRRRG